MDIKFVSILVLSAAVLVGCQSTIKGDPAPPPQDVTPGSTFTVTKEFLVPSGDSSVYFQDARLYPQGEIQPDLPVCELMTGPATADGWVMTTRTFTVSNVEYDEDGIGPSGAKTSVTIIHLRDASNVAYQMSCMFPFKSQGARFVTPSEIQSAVGGYMNLKDAP